MKFLYPLTAAALFGALPVSAANDPLLRINVSGVDEALEKNIRAHLGSLPESEVQRRAFLFNVQDSVDAALQSVGYYHGELNQNLIRHDKGPWELTLTVSPGEPTRIDWVDIRFAGEMLNDAAFDTWLDGVSLRPGQVLNHGNYENLKAELGAIALSRGYFDGKYTKAEIRVNRDENRATISLHFDSSARYRLGDVSFEGHTLDEGFLDRLIPFEHQSPYATRRLSALNSRLQETGYFRSTKVLPQLDKAENGEIPIKVELDNRPDHSIELGLGGDIGSSSDSTFEPRVRVTWRTPQINSHGHSQETSIEWSPDRPKFLTTYTIPLTHPLDDQLKLRLGLLRDKYGVTQVYEPEDLDFRNTGQLESSKQLLGVLRQQSLGDGWLMGYSLDFIRESYTQFDTDYSPSFLLAGFSLSNTVRGDATLDPKWGYRQSYSVDYADPSLGSATRLSRFQAKFKWIDTFFTKHRLVARADFGLNLVSDGDLALVPPSLRYFTGGDQSIRGYAFQEIGPYIEFTNDDGQIAREVIGGRYLAVGSLEYQYYLTPSWRLGSFVDAGNAFDKDKFEPVVSVGGGVHWISPIGPIKLDLGVGLTETDTLERSWRIHLTMGSEL
ncbi:autotransporter assembly complex protein TamA [Shewanella amazonensis]|uniref:autotransporter assembly complex protein TamA n=1 Tax=Shewanella amazonensis TaxID=60478 RepID=UPI00067480BD